MLDLDRIVFTTDHLASIMSAGHNGLAGTAQVVLAATNFIRVA